MELLIERARMEDWLSGGKHGGFRSSRERVRGFKGLVCFYIKWVLLVGNN